MPRLRGTNEIDGKFKKLGIWRKQRTDLHKHIRGGSSAGMVGIIEYPSAQEFGPLTRVSAFTSYYWRGSVTHSCLTLCDPIDCSPPGSPVPGILQARILEWVAISFSNA